MPHVDWGLRTGSLNLASSISCYFFSLSSPLKLVEENRNEDILPQITKHANEKGKAARSQELDGSL